jgi:hypothetical protein
MYGDAIGLRFVGFESSRSDKEGCPSEEQQRGPLQAGAARFRRCETTWSGIINIYNIYQ